MARTARELRRAVSDEEKELRRQTILSGAKRVFSERGYAATTVADVARAAHLSYGTIYWYFESKEELFDALMDAGEASLRTRILTALDEGGPADLEGALRTSVRATFEHFDEDREATRLLFRDSYALGGRFERHLINIYEGFIDDLETTITTGQRQGRDPRGTAPSGGVRARRPDRPARLSPPHHRRRPHARRPLRVRRVSRHGRPAPSLTVPTRDQPRGVSP